MKTKEEVKTKLEEINGFIDENRKLFKSKGITKGDIEEINEDLHDLRIRKNILEWITA